MKNKTKTGVNFCWTSYEKSYTPVTVACTAGAGRLCRIDSFTRRHGNPVRELVAETSSHFIYNPFKMESTYHTRAYSLFYVSA